MREDATSVNVFVLFVLLLVGALVGHFTRSRQPQTIWMGVAGVGAVLLLAGFVTIPALAYLGAGMVGAGLAGALTQRVDA